MAPVYRLCPRCGLPNIRERRTCKRCRVSLDAPFQPTPVTDQTGHLYYDHVSNETLFILPTVLEYSTPMLTFRSPWENIRAIKYEKLGAMLRLLHPAMIIESLGPPVKLDNPRLLSIPLYRFQYPGNAALHRDLQRFAPQLQLE